ncbi:MAG: hypothetical protein KatS3mg117_2663 [Geminicoccaceae bacterium]|jgi:ElaB/YqjD/DUF883 family membrane-anchored ribosome-binding protein|nr:MAG: hypothetical protein KatS3mg117_2663 [Geminicoccaceae bacterium]
MASSTEALGGASEGPAPLPRRPWFDDRVDRLLLLVFFVGGFALILLVKLAGRGLVTWRGEPVEPRFLAAGLAVVLMLLYAAVASQTRTFRLHPERLGDNCYYLGLLYTLASLVAALVELERTDAAERGTLLESLLASFGIALLSTVLGIALRVWFVQTRRELEDLEAELQRDLQEAAQKLKDQLLFAVTDLESFRLRTQQVLESRLTEATSAVVDGATRQARALEELGQRTVAALEPAVEPLTLRIRAFSESAQAILAANRELVERLRAIEVPHDLLVRPVAQLQRAIADLARLVAGLEETTGRMTASLERETSALELRLSGLATPIGQLVQGLQAAAAAGRGLEGLGAEIEPLRAKLSALASDLDELLAAARDDAREIRGLRDQIRADLREYQRAQQQLGGTLVAIADGVVRRLGG